MLKEAKHIDFYTTGRQPSEREFAYISEWIKKNKQKQTAQKKARSASGKKQFSQQRSTKSTY